MNFSRCAISGTMSCGDLRLLAGELQILQRPSAPRTGERGEFVDRAPLHAHVRARCH